MPSLFSKWFQFFRKTPSSSSKTPADLGKHYLQLRDQIIGVTAEQLGPLSSQPVWAVLMETGYPDMVVTLFAGVDGATSLYFSNGGGIIGAGEHENVRPAALGLVREAGQFRATMEKVDAFPLPPPDDTRFYVCTPDGVYSSQAKEDDLANNRDPLSPLFYAGHELISQVRIMDEKRRAEDSGSA